jgi:hypothetical protein
MRIGLAQEVKQATKDNPKFDSGKTGSKNQKSLLSN